MYKNFVAWLKAIRDVVKTAKKLSDTNKDLFAIREDIVNEININYKSTESEIKAANIKSENSLNEFKSDVLERRAAEYKWTQNISENIFNLFFEMSYIKDPILKDGSVLYSSRVKFIERIVEPMRINDKETSVAHLGEVVIKYKDHYKDIKTGEDVFTEEKTFKLGS